MSQSHPEPGEPADPSMEDILASIRRILNDGETDPDHAAPHEGVDHLHAAQQTADEDVFMLDETMLIKDPLPMQPYEPAVETAYEPPAHAATPAAEHPAPSPAEPEPQEPLVAATTAAAASASLGALVRVIGQRHTQVYRGGPTLEDIVRDEIRPLVKAWMDENLAPMVERLVRIEIDRVSRL